MGTSGTKQYYPKGIAVEPALWEILTVISQARYGKRYALSPLVREILHGWVRENGSAYAPAREAHGGVNAKA